MALSKIDAANFLTGTIPSGNISTASLAAAATGKVLQVVTTPKTDRFSTSSTSYTDVTGLSVNITPSATSSKIFVIMDVVGGPGNNVSMFLRLMRDSTAIHVATGSVGNRFTATAGASDDPSQQFPLSMTASVLDSPSSTSQITYKVQMATEASGNTGTCHINRSGEDQNNTQNGYFASSITVMEVSA